MRLSILLLSIVSTVAAASSPSPSLSAEVFYWPVTAPQPAPLAQISYDPSTLESKVLSYTPPDGLSYRVDEDDGLVRVGFFTSTPANAKLWVGSLASWSSLAGKTADGEGTPTLQLHLSPKNDFYHVALSSSPLSASPTLSPPGLNVELVRPDAAPRPYLNKPVVVSPDGKGPEEVVEKTFFQKYWWVFLIITFLAMSGSGEQGQ